MSDKIKVEDLKCFNEVSEVIGGGLARTELFKVVNTLDYNDECNPCGYFNLDTLLSESLIRAFDWDYSLQGWGFWCKVDRGVNPYKI